MRKKSEKLEFDYIVIGTGPAGAVIAKTLSDNRDTSVLVLEAGENRDRDKPIRDSSFALELEEEFFPQYFWQGEGVPQEGLNGSVFEWTTGRLSGGGSSINGEQYVRPTTDVLKQWQALDGPAWSPAAATRRFKQLEKFNGQTDRSDIHGYHGRVDIRQAPAHPTEMARKLTAAIEQATGFPEILDYNDPQTPLGPFTRWQLYQQPNGRRESASTAFLAPDVVSRGGRGVKGRKLRVFYRSTALRVLFENKRAVGVEFLKDGKCMQAYAGKSVIVSAGINSAQLLMLSGVGPARQLRSAGIPVVFDNPNVGKGLRNHTLNFAQFSVNPADSALPEDDPDALYTGGAFLPSPLPGADRNKRAVQLAGIGSDQTLTIAIIYLKPKSRGDIRVQSKDPLTIVLADEGFLQNRDDLEAVKSIYQTYIRNIASALAAIDPSYRLISPAEDVLNDDEKLEEFIKETFEHNHHQQSSLRMAPLRKGGVVDARGRVHGVTNLLVADDSIIPFTVDGNTSAPAFLIGLTVAEQIIGRKSRSKSSSVRDKSEE